MRGFYFAVALSIASSVSASGFLKIRQVPSDPREKGGGECALPCQIFALATNRAANGTGPDSSICSPTVLQAGAQCFDCSAQPSAQLWGLAQQLEQATLDALVASCDSAGFLLPNVTVIPFATPTITTLTGTPAKTFSLPSLTTPPPVFSDLFGPGSSTTSSLSITSVSTTSTSTTTTISSSSTLPTSSSSAQSSKRSGSASALSSTGTIYAAAMVAVIGLAL